jgi:hypothetical protein
MMTDEQAQRVALFFLFSLMDEKLAHQSACSVVASLKSKVPASDSFAEACTPAIIVQAMHRTYDSHRKTVVKTPVKLTHASTDVVPTFHSWMDGSSPLDLIAWSRFHKDAPEAEMVAVVLSKVLGFSEQEIASGLNVSVNTVRYRVGKGIRHLGKMVEKVNREKT